MSSRGKRGEIRDVKGQRNCNDNDSGERGGGTIRLKSPLLVRKQPDNGD